MMHKCKLVVLRKKTATDKKHARSKTTVFSIVLFVLLFVIMTACGASNSGDDNTSGSESDYTLGTELPETASRGLIETQEGAKDSTILWVDDSLKTVGNSQIPYGDLCMLSGFQNAVYDVEKVILASPATDKAEGAIIEVDKRNGAVTTYPHDRVNFTSYSADMGKVALVSNLNWDFYLDLITRETGEMQSIKMKEEVQAGDVVLAGEKVFVTAQDTNDHYALYEVNIDSGETKKCLAFKEEPSFIVYDDEWNLYFVDDAKLVQYHVINGAMSSTELGRTSEFYNLYMDHAYGYLWIGYTDIHSEEDSYVEKRDLSTGDVVCSSYVQGSIWQMEAAGDELFILGFENFRVYDASDEGLSLREEIQTDANGFFRVHDVE